MFDGYSNRQLRQVIHLQFAIILNLANRLDTIITDAENIANERLAELVQKQVDHDNRILDGWKQVNEDLWQEFQAYQLAQPKSKKLAKEAKRLRRLE